MLRPNFANVLIPDHALAIDDEAFGHSGRTNRELDRTDVIRTDPGERVAVAGQKRHRHAVHTPPAAGAAAGPVALPISTPGLAPPSCAARVWPSDTAKVESPVPSIFLPPGFFGASL